MNTELTTTKEVRPKNGQKFKAYEIATGQKAKGDPFRAKRITSKKIEAVDRFGWLRVFPFDVWRFKLVGS